MRFASLFTRNRGKLFSDVEFYSRCDWNGVVERTILKNRYKMVENLKKPLQNNGKFEKAAKFLVQDFIEAF